MRKLTILVASLALFSLACAGGEQVDEGTLTSQKQALNAIGADCRWDSDCASGLCFDTADAYPAYNPSWEQGYVCTVECEEEPDPDAFCRQLAAQYNAPRPNDAVSRWVRGVYDNGPDAMYLICDLIPAGLGSYWSE